MSDRRIYAAWLAGTIAIVLGCLASGCAASRKDVVAVADVCRPELIPDVEQAAPYVAVYVSCEIAHGDCTDALAALKALGKADAIACAAAEAHAATVKLAGQ